MMETARSRIKKALVDLLADHEFSKISVTQICKEAKLSRVTFYLWYDGKDTLLNDYFQDIVYEGIQYYGELRKKLSGGSIQEDFKGLLETLFYLGNRYHEFVSHMVGDNRHEDPVLFSRFKSLDLKQVTDLVKEHSDEIVKPVSITEVSYFLSSGLGTVIINDLNAGISPAVVHEHVALLLDQVLGSGIFLTR